MPLRVTFPISKVSTLFFLPSLAAFVFAYFGAMAGVTGAFLLLPFQMSVLGYTAPGVSATNFVYNIFAIPLTVYRYTREGRMNWPLAAVITLGSMPGIFVGYFLRVRYLTDPMLFMPFAGLVLLYLAWLVGRGLFGKGKTEKKPAPAKGARIHLLEWHWKRVVYGFDGAEHVFDPRLVGLVSAVVGIVGGAYGIGGGAVLAPFCISVLRLPVHTVAGASLFGTFMSSLVGVVVYHFGFFSNGMNTKADYLLGACFGIGGLVGGYLGARTQKHIPERPIKLGIFLIVLFVAVKYLLRPFLG